MYLPTHLPYVLAAPPNRVVDGPVVVSTSMSVAAGLRPQTSIKQTKKTPFSTPPEAQTNPRPGKGNSQRTRGDEKGRGGGGGRRSGENVQHVRTSYRQYLSYLNSAPSTSYYCSFRHLYLASAFLSVTHIMAYVHTLPSLPTLLFHYGVG